MAVRVRPQPRGLSLAPRDASLPTGENARRGETIGMLGIRARRTVGDAVNKTGEVVAKLACNRSFEDAAQEGVDMSVDAARVGACATLIARRVFIAFGGPQGHGDSLTVAALKCAVGSQQLAEPRAPASGLSANFAITSGDWSWGRKELAPHAGRI